MVKDLYGLEVWSVTNQRMHIGSLDQGKAVQSISFLTYNIWFESHYQVERYTVLMRILEQSDADFICLQEVITDFKTQLLQEPWVA